MQRGFSLKAYNDLGFMVIVLLKNFGTLMVAILSPSGVVHAQGCCEKAAEDQRAKRVLVRTQIVE